MRFADFEFDATAGELRRGGATIRLEPQPARVLAVLVERAGEVVTRAELQQRVWSEHTFVDFEHGLNYCVAQIRTALGDSASEPKFLETLPRRGYRFIAPVEKTTPGFMRHRRRAVGAAAAALVLAAAAGAWALFARNQAASAVRDDRVRIAVVLFDNETGQPDYDRLAQSLTDATVARLAGDANRLAVIGNAAILRSPRSARDLKAIGRALDVGHLVLGQVQLVGGRLRITAHLIRAHDEAHLWARPFEPSPADVSTVDREVSGAVADAVRRRVLGGSSTSG